MRRLTAGAGLLLALAVAHPARAETPEPVALELVIAIDVSASVDAREYELQIGGIVAAFRDPEVAVAVGGLTDGVAVALLQWSEAGSTALSVPFQRLTDARTAKAFAHLVSLAPRGGKSGFTAIGSAIRGGARLLDLNGFDGRHRVIDVSGDGRSNAAPHPEEERDRAVASGITVNGLVILTDDPALATYYRRSVIGGRNAFVEDAADYDAFADAFLRKLLRELVPPIT